MTNYLTDSRITFQFHPWIKIFSNEVYKNQVKDLVEHSLNIPLRLTNSVSEVKSDWNEVINMKILKKRLQISKNNLEKMKISFLTKEKTSE